MCNFENGFVLCTCLDKNQPIVHHKKNRKQQLLYQWTLYRAPSELPNFELTGIFIFPKSDIGKGLTAAWVLLNLNDRNCFDVDYLPQEKDSLTIQQELEKNKELLYLSFVFRNGQWLEEYDEQLACFSTKLLQGKVNQLANEK